MNSVRKAMVQAACEQFALRLTLAIVARRRNGNWLASTVGVSNASVSKWTHGTCLPSETNMERVSRALDVPVDWFFQGGPVLPNRGVGAQ